MQSKITIANNPRIIKLFIEDRVGIPPIDLGFKASSLKWKGKAYFTQRQLNEKGRDC